MTCDKAVQVQAYYDGELDAPARAALEAHLQSCAPCSDLLADLRGMSLMIAQAPMPGMPLSSLSRYYGAWESNLQRGVMRITGWLTAAAAILLTTGLLMWPNKTETRSPQTLVTWELPAMMPPADNQGESGAELVQVAQWMANDLSQGERR
jgi:hypothetical protein